MKSILPINRPLTDAPDLNATTFENVDIILYELFTAAAAKGVPLIEGRTFRGCRFQGPAIVLASTGVTFSDTNFGERRHRQSVAAPRGRQGHRHHSDARLPFHRL